MTVDDALAELAHEAGVLRPQDIDDIRAAAASSQDDLLLLLRSYRDARRVTDVTFWDRLAAVLKKLPEYLSVAEAIAKVVALL